MAAPRQPQRRYIKMRGEGYDGFPNVSRASMGKASKLCPRCSCWPCDPKTCNNPMCDCSRHVAARTKPIHIPEAVIPSDDINDLTMVDLEEEDLDLDSLETQDGHEQSLPDESEYEDDCTDGYTA